MRPGQASRRMRDAKCASATQCLNLRDYAPVAIAPFTTPDDLALSKAISRQDRGGNESRPVAIERAERGLTGCLRLLRQRTAIGETVEPVPPLILSGVMMNANSCTFLLSNSS